MRTGCGVVCKYVQGRSRGEPWYGCSQGIPCIPKYVLERGVSVHLKPSQERLLFTKGIEFADDDFPTSA